MDIDIFDSAVEELRRIEASRSIYRPEGPSHLIRHGKQIQAELLNSRLANSLSWPRSGRVMPCVCASQLWGHAKAATIAAVPSRPRSTPQ